MKMDAIDKKKCADLLRDMCDQREKEPHYADIRTEVYNIRKYAESLWPADKNAYTETQWEGLKAGLHWDGTPDELEAGLEEMKAKHDNTKKPEIAY